MIRSVVSRDSPSFASVLLAAVALVMHAGATHTPGDPGPCNATLSCPLNSNCSYVGANYNCREYQFNVEGHKIKIWYYPGTSIHVNCDGFSVLESALPHAAHDNRVRKMILYKCPLPRNISLAAVLEALSVNLASSLHSEDSGSLELLELPRAPRLSAKHFEGLEDLLRLEITGSLKTVQPERGFLRPLQNLRKLKMQRVTLPGGELDSPLQELTSLNLVHTGVERLPATLLNSTKLRNLNVVSDIVLNWETLPPNLLRLTLEPVATLPTPLPAEVRLNFLREQSPKPLVRCEKMTSLYLMAPGMKKLPNLWLSKCSRLKNLTLQYADKLIALPPRMLENVTAFNMLSVKSCRKFKELPAGIFNTTPNLRVLDLTENKKLRKLPSDLFGMAQGVQSLTLSGNGLNSDAVAALTSLSNLTYLDLKGNKRIRNLCDTTGKSAMHESTQLETLILRYTDVNRICLDWRTNMENLKTLDLRNTSLTELWVEHLQFKSNATVMLEGAPVTVLKMNRTQFIKAVNRQTKYASVQLDSKIKCDCHMYWARRALQTHEKMFYEWNCQEEKLLREMAAEDMMCTEPDNITSEISECAAGVCACSWRPDEELVRDGTLVRVNCTGQGMDHVPRPAGIPGRYYELLLSHNNITQLHADDLQHNIKRLDLFNNSLSSMDEETVTKLYSFKGLLQLANNSLDCSCSNANMVSALNSRAANLSDLELMRCAGGGLVTAATFSGCMSLMSWLACGLAVLLALTILVVVFLSSRERRFFFKAVLHRWGCLWYGAEPEEDRDRLYDAFVTFSHKDEPTVLKLMARLEPTYRLCVHHRDWIPGRYITEQIGESVANSRCTIALVSRHYQDSGWALAEFHLAHAAAMREARPRLVVVMLEDPSVLQLDDELSRYLETNTYVRWGDSWFWDKLKAALPRPRPANTAPPAETRAVSSADITNPNATTTIPLTAGARSAPAATVSPALAPPAEASTNFDTSTTPLMGTVTIASPARGAPATRGPGARRALSRGAAVDASSA